MKILIVEDDTRTREFIELGLQQSGHRVESADNGRDGWLKAAAEPFDLAVVDVMLPELDGVSLVKKWRAARLAFPVIILSARASESDKIAGLEAGADDYLAKPFSLAELVARVNAQIRRASAVVEPAELVVADLRLNIVTRKVFRGDDPIVLQPLEFQLLEYLMRNKGRVVSKSTIIEHVWDYNFDTHTNIVESRMSRLRDKVDDPYDRKLIATVRGFGYRME
ncbi:MAG: response regulator transcription factor [Kiritimatiellaeota bacterium]|nr:response regulator transcription factor [Kiritimatiellota bacterium]